MSYSGDYDNSLSYSPTFHEYLVELAAHLAARYSLGGKRIIEIGSGDGQFLHMLCKATGAVGVGFDPSDSHADNHCNVWFVRDFYSVRYSNCRAELICCRHVLEHIPNPAAFMSTLAETAGKSQSTILYFEVPNARFVLGDLSIFDLIYEHCSYFTSRSLEHLFSRRFQVLDVHESFGGQFLSLEAASATEHSYSTASPGSDPGPVGWRPTQFRDEYRRKIDAWSSRLHAARRDGLLTAVWGAGSKGVMFANMLGLEHEIGCFVDINPRKVGKYVPGTGHPIVSPGCLRRYQPGLILIMNEIYRGEIESAATEAGVRAEYACV